MDRKNYLAESKPGYSPLNAIEEASRCLLCHDAPCSKACPAGTNPEKFIRSIRFRNVKGAVETIREANILGACCARVCPYDKLCEEACSRTGIDRPIDIGGLQRFAMDFEKASGMKVLEAPEATLEKVAVVGSGPAGLAAAGILAQKGYRVTVFEEKEKAGGVLTYGIVPARLPQEVVDFEVDMVRGLGVEFRFNTRVGKDATIDRLKAEGYKAFFIAVGLQGSSTLNIPGIDLEGVTSASQFLASAKPTGGEIDVPENVIIIGGGDVAMDCATTAKELGGRNVAILYRRTILEMPANKAEVEHVRKLGISIISNFNPVEIIGENGRVKAIKAVGVDWKDRSTPVDVPETVLQMKAELVIQAIGQKPEDLSYTGVMPTGKGLAAADPETGKTNIDGVYMAGDIVNGGKTVVEAVARGKSAALSIDAYLSSKREGGR